MNFFSCLAPCGKIIPERPPAEYSVSFSPWFQKPPNLIFFRAVTAGEPLGGLDCFFERQTFPVFGQRASPLGARVEQRLCRLPLGKRHFRVLGKQKAFFARSCLLTSERKMCSKKRGRVPYGAAAIENLLLPGRDWRPGVFYLT